MTGILLWWKNNILHSLYLTSRYYFNFHFGFFLTIITQCYLFRIVCICVSNMLKKAATSFNQLTIVLCCHFQHISILNSLCNMFFSVFCIFYADRKKNKLDFESVNKLHLNMIQVCEISVRISPKFQSMMRIINVCLKFRSPVRRENTLRFKTLFP